MEIGYGWDEVLQSVWEESASQQLTDFLAREYHEHVVFPPREELFAAFRMTRFEDVKVVILGQDPYHHPGQANGLSFSVNQGVPLPPSLRNIYEEMRTDLQCELSTCGDLRNWARQGVLLLNTVLTVRQQEPLSHRDCGWETFTDAVIRQLSARTEPMVFVLWGRPAQQKKALIDERRHASVESPHPSPLSAYRGFFGSKPFSRINELLSQFGYEQIRWESV